MNRRLAAFTEAGIGLTLVALLATPHAATPGYQYGLTGNDWWAGLNHKTATAGPAGAPAYQFGLTGNAWWSAHSHHSAPRGE